MGTFVRYLLLQIPGVVLAGWITPDTAALATGLWVAKDLALYPLLREAYRPWPGHAAEQLVGARARVAEALAPQGWVRVRGELWRARLENSGAEVGRDEYVRIVASEGLELVCEPDRPLV
jgi:membrane-bound ClpP family serine protease